MSGSLRLPPRPSEERGFSTVVPHPQLETLRLGGGKRRAARQRPCRAKGRTAKPVELVRGRALLRSTAPDSRSLNQEAHAPNPMMSGRRDEDIFPVPELSRILGWAASQRPACASFQAKGGGVATEDNTTTTARGRNGPPVATPDNAANVKW